MDLFCYWAELKVSALLQEKNQAYGTLFQARVQVMTTKLTFFMLVMTNKTLNAVFLILKLNFQYKEK